MLSPRTTSMLQQGAGQTTEENFRQGFQDLALSQAASQLDTLADSIVSFKVIEADLETNTATGSIILERNGDEIHVPVILSQNKLMPMDLMYVKTLDMVLPLSPAWLGEVDRTSTQPMGSAVKTPDDVASDRDIRNIVVPPTTGRYSYASDATYRAPDAFYAAPNSLKRRFFEMFSKNEKLAAYALKTYGADVFTDMLAHQGAKIAGSTADAGTALHVMTIETPIKEIEDVHLDSTPKAMRDIALKGYATFDERIGGDIAEYILEEGPLWLENPTSAGFYNTYRTYGEEKLCLVFTRVYDLSGGDWYANCSPIATSGSVNPRANACKLLLQADGTLLLTRNQFMARMAQLSAVPEKFKKMLSAPRKGTPRNGQRGFFCDASATSLEATEPIKVATVRRDNDTGRLTLEGTTYDGARITVIQDPAVAYSSPRSFDNRRADNVYDHGPSYSFRTKGESNRLDNFRVGPKVVYIPTHYKFIPVTSIEEPDNLLRNASAIQQHHEHNLRKSGGKRPRVKNAQDGTVYVDGASFTKAAAVESIARNYNVRARVASYIVEKAASVHTVYSPWIVHPTTLCRLVKQAQEVMEMPPSEPSAVEMAAQAVAADLMEQQGAIREELQDQQRTVQLQLEAIQKVLGLASQMQQQMDPAMMQQQMDPAMMQQQMDPAMMQQQMDPAMVQQQMDPAMMQQQMDPAMMQQQMPVEGPQVAEQQQVDPAMMQQMQQMQQPQQQVDPAMMQQQMDPAMMQQQMDPAMMQQQMDPAMMQQQMPVEGPQMMEAAADLDDPDMFDTAAMASIAKQDDFKHMVNTYTPMLQTTLDKVGRLLLEMRMHREGFEARFGPEGYTSMLAQLKTIFDGVGDVVISINEASTDTDPRG